MDLIKETVLEKLANSEEKHSPTESFIQEVDENGITYKREYISGYVDRYQISEGWFREVGYSYYTGSYEQPGTYIHTHQCLWQQEYDWNPQTQGWEGRPLEITLKDFIDDPRNKKLRKWDGEEKEAAMTSKMVRGNISLKGETGNFAQLWNCYVKLGEKEFLALKNAGCSLAEFKAKQAYMERIARAKRKVENLKYDNEWKNLKAAVLILSKDGEKGKMIAQKLIRDYRFRPRL